MPDSPLPEGAVQAAARALVTHQWAGTPWSAHEAHQYDSGCAVCQGDVPAIVAAVAPFIAEHIARTIESQTPFHWTRTQARSWAARIAREVFPKGDDQ
jgi:hypothetical protein